MTTDKEFIISGKALDYMTGDLMELWQEVSPFLPLDRGSRTPVVTEYQKRKVMAELRRIIFNPENKGENILTLHTSEGNIACMGLNGERTERFMTYIRCCCNFVNVLMLAAKAEMEKDDGK